MSKDTRGEVYAVIEKDWPVHETEIAKKLGLKTDKKNQKHSVARVHYHIRALKEQEKIMADCMDARCTLTGDSVILTDIVGFDMEIPTAICECSTFEQNGVKTPVSASATLGGNCNQDNCSAIWSTASDSYRGVLNTVHQCDDC